MPNDLPPIPTTVKPEKCGHGSYTAIVTEPSNYRFANTHIVRVVMCNGCASFFRVPDVPYDVASGR